MNNKFLRFISDCFFVSVNVLPYFQMEPTLNVEPLVIDDVVTILVHCGNVFDDCLQVRTTQETCVCHNSTRVCVCFVVCMCCKLEV